MIWIPLFRWSHQFFATTIGPSSRLQEIATEAQDETEEIELCAFADSEGPKPGVLPTIQRGCD